MGSPIAAESLAGWLGWALGEQAAPGSPSERLLERGARMAGIERRSSCVADHTHRDEERLELYRRDVHGVLTAPLDARMQIFERVSDAVARRAFASIDDAPDHLLQVSCTGYRSPSAVQVVASERGWLAGTTVQSLGHMGCHAAVPALRAAADAVGSTASRRHRPARASVLHLELCTLHLRPDPVERRWLTHAALFADGAARVDVGTEAPPVGFEVLDDFEQLVAGTTEAMTWRLGADGFRMHLGKEVVRAIRTHTRDAVDAFLQRNGLDVGAIAQFALHPGGPRILDACAEALELRCCTYRHSTHVFRNHGNMSSATLPHIWAEILADRSIPDGALVCSVAFGPGLTVCGNLLRVVRS